MTSIDSTIATINLLGTFNGLLLAVVLLVSGARGSGAWWLGALLLCASLALALISLEHQHWIPRRWWVYSAEEFFSLLSGPLLLTYVLKTFRLRAPAWIFVPPGLYLLALTLPMIGLPRFYGMHHVMWIQIAYSIVAVVVFFGQQQGLRRTLRAPERIAGWVLATIFLVHLAQITRRLLSGSGVLTNVVPIVGTACFYLLLIYALRQSGITRQLGRAPPTESEGSRRQFEQIEAVMKAQRPWLDPRLDLESLSGLTGLGPQTLSSVIAAHSNSGFYDYVAGWRLGEATRLLADPDEARYTIEGIARQCGFGSRSAFYKAFREHTGQTPSEYRREILSQPNPD